MGAKVRFVRAGEDAESAANQGRHAFSGTIEPHSLHADHHLLCTSVHKLNGSSEVLAWMVVLMRILSCGMLA